MNSSTLVPRDDISMVISPACIKSYIIQVVYRFIPPHKHHHGVTKYCKRVKQKLLLMVRLELTTVP